MKGAIMTILITGGTTFVSKYVAKYFVSKGNDVTVINRGSRPQVDGVTHINCDRTVLGEALNGKHFDLILDITAYTKEHIKTLLDSGVAFDDYIFISSSAVYPETNQQPFTEEQSCGYNSVWGDYGINKLKAEEYLQANVPNAYILRPPYFYGINNNLYREAFPFDCAMQDRPFYLPQNGEMKLQFFNIYDLCRFIDILIDKHPDNHIFNIGNKETITVKEWVDICYKAVGKTAEYISVKKDIAQRNYFCFYDYEYVLDVSKQSELMQETVPLEKGIKEEFEWYKDNCDSIYDRKSYIRYIDDNLNPYKPKLTPEELVDKMKNKGITFKYISETDAIEYLRVHNNYFRLASYRKNYDKHQTGKNKGKYISLDFSYLIDLSTIDMHLRYLIIKMCLDIEHFLKVFLLEKISLDSNEDGYNIVNDFIDKNNYIEQEICKKRFSTYVGELINKYFEFESIQNEDGNTIIKIKKNKCPVWAFMEIIGFGDFIKFYKFYYSIQPNQPIPDSCLNLVKSIRNACAHNNCVIHNLRSGNSRPPFSISKFVGKIKTISKNQRESRLKHRPILELVSLLYVYDSIVVDTVKQHRLKELDILLNDRIIRNKDYFQNQQIFSSTYCFFRKIVDFLM